MHRITQKPTLNTIQNINTVEELVAEYAHFLYPQPSELQLQSKRKISEGFLGCNSS